MMTIVTGRNDSIALQEYRNIFVWKSCDSYPITFLKQASIDCHVVWVAINVVADYNTHSGNHSGM